MNLFNKIFIVINSILMLFIIFSSKIIIPIQWSNDGIAIGDIATIISAIIMMITTSLMYQANKMSLYSIEETQKIHRYKTLIDLIRELSNKRENYNGSTIDGFIRFYEKEVVYRLNIISAYIYDSKYRDDIIVKNICLNIYCSCVLRPFAVIKDLKNDPINRHGIYKSMMDTYPLILQLYQEWSLEYIKLYPSSREEKEILDKVIHKDLGL